MKTKRFLGIQMIFLLINGIAFRGIRHKRVVLLTQIK